MMLGLICRWLVITWKQKEAGGRAGGVLWLGKLFMEWLRVLVCGDGLLACAAHSLRVRAPPTATALLLSLKCRLPPEVPPAAPSV